MLPDIAGYSWSEQNSHLNMIYMWINREGCSLIKVWSKTLLFNTKFVGSLLLLFFCFCFFFFVLNFCYLFVVFVHCHPLHIYNRKKCYCFPSPFSQKLSRSVHHGKYDFVFRFIFSSRLLVTVDPLDVLSFSYKLTLVCILIMRFCFMLFI